MEVREERGGTAGEGSDGSRAWRNSSFGRRGGGGSAGADEAVKA